MRIASPHTGAFAAVCGDVFWMMRKRHHCAAIRYQEGVFNHFVSTFSERKQKALLFSSAFCIEGWESINKNDVINFSVFIILFLLHLSKENRIKNFIK